VSNRREIPSKAKSTQHYIVTELRKDGGIQLFKIERSRSTD